MKFLGTTVLMLNLGVAGIYAQPGNVNLTLSGTATPSTVNLGTGTATSEYNLAGNGTLGSFTFRTVSSSAASQQVSSSCSGPTKAYFPVLAGEGVFRFDDGSLLDLNLTGGSDCVDFSGQPAICTRIYQVTGGTGRFKSASGSGGTVTLIMMVSPAVPGKLGFFAVTGEVTGAVPGVATNQGSQNAQP